MSATLLTDSRAHDIPRATSFALFCGILASALYVAINVAVPLLDRNYNWLSQTVSELSAIGAPTRRIWIPLGALYSLLVVVFGFGVWARRGRSRSLGLVGVLLILNGVLSLYWPPMHLRGIEGSLTDTLHIVWAGATVILMIAVIIAAATSFGRRFRTYSFVTLAILMVTGMLTGLDGPRIAANLPTPWVGLWERISIAAYMLWIIVFAVTLLRMNDRARVTQPSCR